MRKYKKGEKVVIRKDLEIGKDYGDFEWHVGKEHLKEKDYVVISKYYGEAYEIDECIITDEMIEGLYKDVKKYVWYLDSEGGAYFLNNLLGADKWTSDEVKEIKNGKDACYLLTEEKARKSPFFDKFAKHDPFKEKLYYIRMKGNQKDYLISNTNDGEYFMYDNDEYIPFKSTFTEEECNEIIGNSSILYKEECR